MNWCMRYIPYWTAHVRSNRLWSSQAMILAVMNAMICFIYCIYHFPHGLDRTHKWPAHSVSDLIAQLVRASHCYNGFKSRWSPEFSRLPYAIAKIAFITASIFAHLNRAHVAVCLRRHHYAVRTSVTLAERSVCHLFGLITFKHHLWCITEQTHGNMEYISWFVHDKYINRNW